MFKKLLLTYLISCSLIFCMSPKESFADVLAELEQAETYDKDRLYDQAEAAYQAIVTNYPSTEYAFTAQTNLVTLYISIERDSDAEKAFDKLTGSFSDNSALPAAVHGLARKYEGWGKYDKALEIYEQIILQYAGTSTASETQLDIPKIGILYHIDSLNYTHAKARLDKLTADFYSHPGLPAALYAIAQKYEWSKKYEEAKSIYSQISQQYSSSSYANPAQLDAAKMDILTSINSGKIEEAQNKVTGLVAGFSEHPSLPTALYDIARTYEWSKKPSHEAAISLYQQIIQKYPGSWYASEATLDITKNQVMSYIDQGNDEAVATVLEKLVADFSGRLSLSKAIYDIAAKYEITRKYTQAENLYKQTTQQYSSSDWYSRKAQLDARRMNIMALVQSEDYTAAKSAVDQLVVDFPEHRRLQWAVFSIAEEYFNRAIKIANQGSGDQANICFHNAIEIWKVVSDRLPYSAATPKACCFIGDSYRKRGEYSESIPYYQKVVNNWSDSEYAWHAQFMVGRSYEDLIRTGVVPESEAIPLIRAAYKQLLKQYPNTRAVKHAQEWLSSNN